ncbi:MAG: aminopeptidase P N-terminal domain-containing protein [Gemmatimonadales bacterium]|nr:aminopeptidase P N-terminal domain-containing protein [Gemmatimonadales bacterium]MBP6570856.1 aminopeptidase P N-terminal domain-containing protein [Gemmatimonadales bacterium]MBP7619577.1 aminopeptidase P N-terminal domain-containing protein [Gemmatimonadales bacterium]
MARRTSITAMGLVLLAAPLAAQGGFTDVFPPEEFAAHRAKVTEHIGEGVAVIQGATEARGEWTLRQGNQFFYLSGVIEPRAMLIIDGRTKRTTLFLNAATPRVRQYGPYLTATDSARRVTGVDAVMPRDSFAVMLAALDGRVIYTPFRPETQSSESASDVAGYFRRSKADPWDGRVSREELFVAAVKRTVPAAQIKDLDPILDSLRAFKTPREIALIREASRLAGLGIMEAMRDTKPGMLEHELEAPAEYVYKRGGAYGTSYFPLIAGGPRMQYTHYHKNRGTLVDGELLQFDWAPDLGNYTADVTRVWPVNGKFTPRQREYYTIYLRLYQAVLTSIRPHVTARAVMDSAYVKMQSIMAGYRFTDPRIKAAAQAMMDRYKPAPAGSTGRGGSLGHTVGMEVHDVPNITRTLEPGYIFTIEPQMTIDGAGELSVRLEDMILITETGYEVLSAFVPIEIADIEALMKQPGIGERALTVPAKGRP